MHAPSVRSWWGDGRFIFKGNVSITDVGLLTVMGAVMPCWRRPRPLPSCQQMACNILLPILSLVRPSLCRLLVIPVEDERQVLKMHLSASQWAMMTESHRFSEGTFFTLLGLTADGTSSLTQELRECHTSPFSPQLCLCISAVWNDHEAWFNLSLSAEITEG